jgi:hypothetical protein
MKQKEKKKARRNLRAFVAPCRGPGRSPSVRDAGTGAGSICLEGRRGPAPARELAKAAFAATRRDADAAARTVRVHARVAAATGSVPGTVWLSRLGVGQGKYLTTAAGLRAFKLSTPAPLRGYTRAYATVTLAMLQVLANRAGRKPTGGWPQPAAAKTESVLHAVCKRPIRGPRGGTLQLLRSNGIAGTSTWPS